jgi:hypothetical protein
MFPQSDYPENCHFAIGNVLEDNPFGKKFDFIQMRYSIQPCNRNNNVDIWYR